MYSITNLNISVENVRNVQQISDIKVLQISILANLEADLGILKYCLEFGHCNILHYVTKLQAKEFRKIVLLPFFKYSFSGILDWKFQAVFL